MSTEPGAGAQASARKPFPSSRGAQFGTLRQIFDDVWWVWGTTRFAPGATFPRNMIVIGEGDSLVVVHPVLLPEAEQGKVEALGPIRHMVRLGDYHGMDDRLYVERYHPEVWAPAGATPLDGVKVDHELIPGGPLPVVDGTVLKFERARTPELVLRLARHGGLLIACDAVQNWESCPEGCSFLGSIMARLMGFRGRSCLGPGWRKSEEPRDGVGVEPDYRRVLELDFRHLVPSHGPPVMETAKTDLRAIVDQSYTRA